MLDVTVMTANGEGVGVTVIVRAWGSRSVVGSSEQSSGYFASTSKGRVAQAERGKVRAKQVSFTITS